jgi:hypothetical protein
MRGIWTQLNHTGMTAAEQDKSSGAGDGVVAGSRNGSIQEEAVTRVEKDRSLGFRVLNETSTSTNPLTGVMPHRPVRVAFSFRIQPNQPELIFKLHKPILHHISNLKKWTARINMGHTTLTARML